MFSRRKMRMKRDSAPPLFAPDATSSPTKSQSDRFFTISNLLSILRALLSIPLFFVMTSGSEDSNMWGAVIMIIAAATDKLDGDLARHFHQETEWGKILDPIADKIGVGTTLVVLLLLGRIPVWFVASVLSRDLLILGAGVWLKQSRGVVLPSNMTGKWAVGIIALTLFLAIISVPPIWVQGGIIISVSLLIASLILYAVRFMNVLLSGTNGNS